MLIIPISAVGADESLLKTAYCTSDQIRGTLSSEDIAGAIPSLVRVNALAELSSSAKLIRVMNARRTSTGLDEARTPRRAWTSQNIGRASAVSSDRHFFTSGHRKLTFA